MLGTKLGQARQGLLRVLDNMDQESNEVGLVSFSTTVADGVEPQPLGVAKFDLAARVKGLRAPGETALYDAVRRGIEMVDHADANKDATRAVVILSDGQSDVGPTHA